MNDIEHQHQAALFQWIETRKAQLPALHLAYAIPNGTRTTPHVAARMKAEGTRRGVPDVHLPCPRGGWAGLWIEMKAPGAYPRPEQRAWMDALRAEGHYVACCHDWQEAADLMVRYLEGKL